jgi:23S rRNA (guanosine2251-2'-O)-methyltransferase
VEEAFAAGREARRLIVVPHRRAALENLVLHATTLRIPVVEVEGGTLTSVTGFDGHQGVALVAAARRFASLDDVLQRAAERGEPPLVLALDSLEDPQNFGTLLRTAEATGVHGVLYPTRHAAPLSPAAVKASAGAVEHLLLVPVEDLAGTLADAHARGLRIVGTDATAPLSYREADLRGPLVLVVGSEGKGVSGPIRRRLDLVVSIPMTGRVASLNAAVAGSVLLVEAAAQRGLKPGRLAGTETQPAEETEPHAIARPETAEPHAVAQLAAEDEPHVEVQFDGHAGAAEQPRADAPSGAKAGRAARTAKARAVGSAASKRQKRVAARADRAPVRPVDDLPGPGDAAAEPGPGAAPNGTPESGPTAATDADLLPD